jgi:hypothetical protein
MTENRITSEDFDATTAALNRGVRSLGIERAISDIDGWRRKLEASGDPGLRPVADDLGRLRELLTAEEPDVEAIGRMLVDLGDRAQAVAVSGTASPVADKLQLLSQMLTDEGRSLLEGEEYPEGR